MIQSKVGLHVGLLDTPLFATNSVSDPLRQPSSLVNVQSDMWLEKLFEKAAQIGYFLNDIYVCKRAYSALSYLVRAEFRKAHCKGDLA
jgi:hypothetical protein